MFQVSSFEDSTHLSSTIVNDEGDIINADTSLEDNYANEICGQIWQLNFKLVS